MADEPNPYLGRTMYIFRPTASQPEFRSATEGVLRAAQLHWDAADTIAKANNAVAVETMQMRDEGREEPASKALENRLRVAFLAKKGATMGEWIEHRSATADFSPESDPVE